MTMTKEERLQSILDELDENVIIDMWNQYAEDNRYDDDHIYLIDEADDIIGKVWPSDIGLVFDDFTTDDYYFKSSVWGWHSFDDIYDVVDDDTLIDYMLMNDEDFGNDDIREILDAEEEEDEEEES